MATNSQIFSKHDMLNILLKEYDTLRAEIIERSGSVTKYLVAATSVAALIGSFIAKDWADLGITETIYLCSTAVMVLIVGICSSIYSSLHTSTIGKYLRHVEKRINDLTGFDLLRWENAYRGPLTGVYLDAEEMTLQPWYLRRRRLGRTKNVATSG